MRLPDPKTLPRWTLGWSLVLAPLAYLVSALASPPLHSTDAAALAEVARHSDRFYLYALFILIGSMLFMPATLGLVRLARGRSPWLAYLGCGLAQLGVLVAVGDSTTELLYWQMGAPGADRAQMVELAHRYDAATGASVVFDVGAVGTIAGIVLLAAALVRARATPAWAAALLPVGTVVNIVGFSMASRGVLVVSSVLLLAGFGRVALDVLGVRGAVRSTAWETSPSA